MRLKTRLFAVMALAGLLLAGCATTRHLNRTLRRIDKTAASYEVPQEVWVALVGLIGTIGWAVKYSVTHKKYRTVITSVEIARAGVKDKSKFNAMLQSGQQLASKGVQRAIDKDVKEARKTT